MNKDLVTMVPFENHNKYISGTTVSAILGVNPYVSAYEVWDKIYNTREAVKGNDFSEKKKRAGLKLEGVIIDMFQEDTGFVVSHTPALYGDVTFVSTQYPFLSGTLDGEYVHPDGRNVILEVKNIGYKSAKQFGDDEVPYFYYLQAMWYCWLFGADAIQFAYLVDGYDFRYTNVMNRDNAIISMMLDTAIHFHKAHILSGIPPNPVNEKEVLLMYPAATKGKTVEADDDMLTAVTFYRELCAQVRELEKNKEAVKDSIISYIRDAEVLGRAGETLATYKTITRMGVDSKALQAENEDIYLRFLKPSSYRKLDVK